VCEGQSVRDGEGVVDGVNKGGGMDLWAILACSSNDGSGAVEHDLFQHMDGVSTKRSEQQEPVQWPLGRTGLRSLEIAQQIA
jgi:hypothetical protein